jgi:hypothetical protein
MASEMEELPEQLKEGILSIPYMEDERNQLYTDKLSGYEKAVINLNDQIDSFKQELKELGYSRKEINGFLIYAGLLHDMEEYEKEMAEMRDYAEAHPGAASVGSVVANTFGMLKPIDSLGQIVGRWSAGGVYIPTNTYNGIYQLTGGAAVTRDTVAASAKQPQHDRRIDRLAVSQRPV